MAPEELDRFLAASEDLPQRAVPYHSKFARTLRSDFSAFATPKTRQHNLILHQHLYICPLT